MRYRSSAMKLEALAKESDDPALDSLRSRLQTLAQVLESRGKRIDSMGQTVSNLTENVKSLELWIMTVVQNLQGT